MNMTGWRITLKTNGSSFHQTSFVVPFNLLRKQDGSRVFKWFFSSQNEPPCLLRKPKRAESEIPSLPEASTAALRFERLRGEISGHLRRELLGHSVTKQPWGLQAVTAGLGRSVYSERTLNPAPPPRSLCFPLRLILPPCTTIPHRLHLFVWTWPMWPSIQMRAQGGFLHCCVYLSSLTAPWLPVRLCQGRTTS